MLTRPYVNCDAQVETPAWMLNEHYEYCENAEMTGKKRRLPIMFAMLQMIF